MTAPRTKTFLLARPEAAALDWIARRLPARVMPDHLTALGVLAAVGIAVAYALSNRDPAWLWAASGLLVVHWFGDSLDGTLARVRRSERPRYGYYLDHLVDAIATALIGIGLGVSPYMLLVTGLVIVIAYLVLSINTYLETQALGVFSLGYGRLGPTEARAALIVVNTLLALGLAPAISVFGLGITVLDVVALGAAAAMAVALGVRAARNLRELARREPARGSRGAVALRPLVLGLRLGEHAEEQVGERDPHHDRLLERHHEPRHVLVVERGQSPLRAAPGVRVEQLGRERQQDAEEADEDLGGRHVEDRPHPGQAQPRADRGEQVPPVEEPGGGERQVLEHVDLRVPERRVVERGDMPQPHRADVGHDAERGMAERPGGLLDPVDPARRRAAGSTLSARA